MKIGLTISLIVVGLLVGCKSVKETNRFAKCEFKINKVTRLEAAAINLLNKRKLRDVNFKDGVKLTKSVASNQLPMTVGFSVGIKNPNDKTAALEGFDYRIFIDNKQVMYGVYENRTEVPPLSATNVNPVFAFDLLRVLKNTGYNSIVNVIFGLINEKHEPVNVVMQVKPHVKILGKQMKYPDYITLSTVYQ